MAEHDDPTGKHPETIQGYYLTCDGCYKVIPRKIMNEYLFVDTRHGIAYHFHSSECVRTLINLLLDNYY